MILQLFEVFRTYSQRNPVVIAKALNITAQLAIKLQAKNSRMMENLMKEIPRFCRDYNHVDKSDVLASAEDP
jgi:hypothetical protein